MCSIIVGISRCFERVFESHHFLILLSTLLVKMNARTTLCKKLLVLSALLSEEEATFKSEISAHRSRRERQEDGTKLINFATTGVFSCVHTFILCTQSMKV